MPSIIKRGTFRLLFSHPYIQKTQKIFCIFHSSTYLPRSPTPIASHVTKTPDNQKEDLIHPIYFYRRP
ncbi:hypothetical protein PCANC_00676 [Puccinia coronata f. sp. avenae]|uniref:Uncharacterized protein n=1 Tax=Puccinia coronata f. sp. avenae TaxID=200324 RepID=A0A2N5SHJ3_9BASI|nr:hypothetical protein PCASD_21624 [Puccinia coronata f. sp. avenae]PLW51506.1 hypothetical protein PCASD_00426 [Puccinia coronata f. sp. avenae]PLW57974.1 hypothetical protein PCANC_00676 [Puccinia coronata f. sp. avenae]